MQYRRMTTSAPQPFQQPRQDTSPIPMPEPINPQRDSGMGQILNMGMSALGNQNPGRQGASGYSQSDWAPVSDMSNPGGWQDMSNDQMMLAKLLRGGYG